MAMAARLATPPWTVGVSVTPREHACRHRVSTASSSTPGTVCRPFSSPRLLSTVSAASREVAETPSSPAAPPSSSSSLGEYEEGGPIQLPDSQDPFSLPSEGITPLQSTASILLTGTIAVLLYRSLRRRLKLAKETRVRSTGLESISEELKKPEKADNLREKVLAPVVKAPPSAWQTLQGAVVAGAIALVLYKFTTYVEAGINSKPVSSAYTIRQLTIAIRTIVNGMCYLATFVFAANSIGLILYTLQLLLGLGPKESTEKAGDGLLMGEDPLKTDSLEEVKKE